MMMTQKWNLMKMKKEEEIEYSESLPSGGLFNGKDLFKWSKDCFL